jgi:hypothetical protein
MISQNPVAGAVVRVLTYPAGTKHPAITDFEKTAFEMIGHLLHPPFRF